jgi:pSer/pThr/pTyr-binding forkhead associated (FHA) protein
MDDSRHLPETMSLPVQGPHRPLGQSSDSPPGPPPLRLVLLPSGMTVDLTRPEMVLGRHSDADIRVPLPDVSRRHCRFSWRDGAWWVVDLNSLNGVFVNDVRVQQVQLRQGDALRVGGFTFQVQLAVEERGTSPGVLQSIADALPEPPQRRAS